LKGSVEEPDNSENHDFEKIAFKVCNYKIMTTTTFLTVS